MAIISIFAVSAMKVFYIIAHGMVVAQTRTIASNLAQEQIAVLKNVNYYRLLVSSQTVSASEPGLNFDYDPHFYPEQQLVVGKITFYRRTLVSKIYENNGVLTETSWANPDTGLKRISVYVIWKEGANWYSSSLTNVRDDPNRTQLSATFIGTVSDGAHTLPDASVTAVENASFGDTTINDGSYSFAVSPGSYTLRCYLNGYFTAYSTGNVIITGQSLVRNFTLARMGVGSVSGYVFKNTHLLISSLAYGTTTTDYQFVELYNPTTYPITISGSNFKLKKISGGGSGTVSDVPLNFYKGTISISSSSYCLLASTSLLTGKYMYPGSGIFSISPAVLFPPGSVEKEKGGMAITNASDATIDRIGYSKSTDSAPDNGKETDGVSAGAGGFDISDLIIRSSSYTETGRFLSAANSNAMDTDNNLKDCWYFPDQGSNTLYRAPRNTSTIVSPLCGEPLPAAIICCNDGLSSYATSYIPSGATYPASKIYLTNIATGTWTLSASSGTRYGEIADFAVTATTQNIGALLVNTVTNNGYVAGRVTDNSGNGLNGILITGDVYQSLTSPQGYYRLTCAPGTYDFTANSGYAAPSYTMDVKYSISVATGIITDNIDFSLTAGGRFSGFVSTNGVDPLPNITLNASAGSTIVQSGLSNTTGKFTINNVPVGPYVVTPVLESREISSPENIAATALAGSTVFIGSFTITGAQCTLQGNVLSGTKSISTGVLLIATTAAISADPPDIDSSFRASSSIYFGTESLSDGSYSLIVPATSGGTAYNLYGWYTTINNGATTTVKKSTTFTANSGQTVSNKNLTW